uniref:RIKEN cDNA 1700003H04 gene n=2 Tax=Mus musculus TaxID=10090 RepID=J3QPK7_MOUSE
METLGEKETLLDDKPRNMLFQGSVALRRGWRRKKYHFSLFTDVLVVSKNVHTKKFKIKDIIPLRYLWISDSADLLGGDSRMACKSIILFWPMEKLVATFCTKEEKKWWYFFLQRASGWYSNGNFLFVLGALKWNFWTQRNLVDTPAALYKNPAILKIFFT